MKSSLFKTIFAILVVSGISSCEKSDDDTVLPAEETEHKFIRVLVNDELSNTLSLVDPVKLAVETFQAQYPKAALYPTQAGRFAAVVHTSNHVVQLFDSGFEGHGDHVDLKGTPKFGALTGDGNKPTHFKSKGDEIITFNDGDGTLSIAKEADFHNSGAKMKTINTGNVAHHGAMTKFDNGSYAITVKDGSVAGSLPERVKIIDGAGKTIFESTVQTKGIHGNASDGKIALFGSSSGILVVESNGNQRLIAYPASFGTAWFSSVYEAKGAGKFVGYSAAVGAYLIDPATGGITPIIESGDINQVKVDYAGNRLVALLHSGEVRIYDLSSNRLIKNGNIIQVTSKDETRKPQIEATSRFLYVTQPKTGALLKININDLSKSTLIKVSEVPYRLSILGIESSESH